MFNYLRTIRAKIKKNLHFFRLIRFPIGKKVYFIGTPEYTNLGDSAIAIAQMLFLEKCGYKKKHIKEFTQSEYNKYSGLIYRYIGKRHLICGIGGGNLGNQWYNEELFRYRFIDAFRDNPIVIFPQTVFFTDDEVGKQAMEASKLYYEKPKNLTIVAREKVSYDFLNTLYHNPQKMLTPDIVLSTTMEDYGVTVKKRSGGLLVFRSDAEQAMTEADRERIISWLNDNDILFKQTDMYTDETVTKDNRMELVRKKMQEFADSQIVITDRLHGMVFATLTGTPCIVFANNHHKVKGTYDWISYLPYIMYASNVEDAIKIIPQLLNMNNCSFDNAALLNRFVQLRSCILDYR